MASAQQKPKKDKGSRNSTRRSGKAPKASQNPSNGKIRVVDEVRKVYDGHQPRTEVTDRLVPYVGNGVRVSGKGKPSGSSYLGVSYKRIIAQAKTRSMTVEAVEAELRSKRESRKMHRHGLTVDQRRQMHKELMARGDKPKPRSKQGE